MCSRMVSPSVSRSSAVIPTEPIGSLPRPASLLEAAELAGSEDPRLDSLYALVLYASS
jgi:hypothetical protein